jgi:HlyD family secretion protein
MALPRWATTLLVLAALATLAACRPQPWTGIEGTGTLEHVELDLAATTGGRVMAVRVDEGDRVTAGDTLVVLNVPTLAAERAQRVARVAAARAALREAEAGFRPDDITRARAERDALSAEVDRASADTRRLVPLAAADMASAQQLEQAQALERAMSARREAADAQLRLMRQGTRPERIAALRSEVQAAEAALASTEAIAADLVLVAPLSGRIVTRRAEPGEVLAAGERALVMAETGRQWVRIYVGQDALPLVRVGQSVTATLDAFPDRRFTGTVRSLASRAEFTPRVALTERERNDLLFAVRVEFRDSTETLKAGLPITVRIAADRP